MAAVDTRAATWLPVLLYHRVVPKPPKDDPYGNFVSVASFESQLRWLRDHGYRTVPLPALETVFSGAQAAGLPRRPLAITFDDGYVDNYEHAWPLLKRYGFQATVFVVTDAIGRGSNFDDAYPRSPMLTAHQIREMSRDGITLGSHTCSHPASLMDLGEIDLARELALSRESLEGLLGAPVTLFAYPHSRHDHRVEKAVARAGYQLACGGTGTRFSRYCLTRVQAPDDGGAALGRRIAWRRLKWMLKGT